MRPDEMYPEIADLQRHEGVQALAAVAKQMGLQFKIGGFPFGADHETHRRTLGLKPLVVSAVALNSAASAERNRP